MTVYSSKATLLFFVVITSLHDGMSSDGSMSIGSGYDINMDCDNSSTCITPTESSLVSTPSPSSDTNESTTILSNTDTMSDSKDTVTTILPSMSITPSPAPGIRRTTNIMVTGTQTVASTSRAVTTTITATTVAEVTQSSDMTKVTDATSTDMSNGGGSDGNPSRIPVEELASAIGVASVVLLILIVILCGLICCYHMFK